MLLLQPKLTLGWVVGNQLSTAASQFAAWDLTQQRLLNEWWHGRVHPSIVHVPGLHEPRDARGREMAERVEASLTSLLLPECLHLRSRNAISDRIKVNARHSLHLWVLHGNTLHTLL